MEKINIAVVEDEGIVAMDIRRSLISMGYYVVFIADSGEKAIDKLKHNKADLVLMDIVLKGHMDGLDAAQIIVEKMNIPVVFLTALEDELTIEAAKQLESVRYLVKPFEDSQLSAIINDVLHENGKYKKANKKPVKFITGLI